MSKDREYSPLDDDTNDTVPGSEETSAAEDEMNEAKENLRKALQEVQEENESQEKSGKKEIFLKSLLMLTKLTSGCEDVTIEWFFVTIRSRM